MMVEAVVRASTKIRSSSEWRQFHRCWSRIGEDHAGGWLCQGATFIHQIMPINKQSGEEHRPFESNDLKCQAALYITEIERVL